MPHVRTATLRRRLGQLAAALAGGALVAAGMAPTDLTAQAEPVAPPATVTADALPTWQINGVVWSQATVGNTVYVTGSFSKARPPGVAPGGPGEVDAGNIFAFDITTGDRVPFPHTLNAQGLVVRGSEDGSRLYVGGDFTVVDGQPRGHIAAFDTATGALVPGFTPSTDGQVRAFGVTGSTLYVGGSFRSASGQPRRSLAAFATSNGSMTSWSPSADDGFVWAMVMAPDRSRVIAGGSFTTLNGVSAYGMGALNASTGETEAWAANARIRTAGLNGAITSLNTDGVQIYGTGYTMGSDGVGKFEGSFAADPSSGAIKWVNDCTGDSYDIFPMGQVAYSVSHRHDCTVVGGFPDTKPRSRWIKATAEPTFPVGTITSKNPYGWDHTGLPYSGLLHWYPDLEFGTYTSSQQAAWSVTGNADYIVLGGEFPQVNGIAQQGLVRFTKRPNGPHARGPINSAAFTPTPVSTESGKVRVIFSSVWDRDDASITYDVYRSPGSRIASFTRTDSEFWKLPSLSYTDSGLAPGSSVRYQIRATDPDGNVQWSAWSPYVTVSSSPPSAYAGAIRQGGASHLWRLGQTSGRLLDDIGELHGTAVGMTLGAAGALTNETNAAVTSPGGSTPMLTTNEAVPTDAEVSVEAWVKTTSLRGGRIVGFGDSATGTSTSGNTDRVLYLDNLGRVNFSVNTGTYRTIYGRNSVNDGKWHHLVGAMGADGMQLFVDGVRVGRAQSITKAKAYSGYWRIGSDQTTGFTNRPTDAGLAGSFDEIAVYPKALTKAEVQAHFKVSGRTGTWTAAPTDRYGSEVAGDKPDLYWRLGETSGVALDSSSSGAVGNLSGVVTRGQAGAVSGNTAAKFDGATGLVVAQHSWNSPSNYSAELWFKTTSVRGGKLIGFGNAASGLSTVFDRHVYMYSNGKLSFGVYNGTKTSLVTPASYNDGQWHHLVATQGPNGMRLWVDAKLVGSNPVTAAYPYIGLWRVGGDPTWGNTLSNYIAGVLDEVAVYPRALAEQDVRDHYTASGRTTANRPPIAAFTTQANGLTVNVDGSTSTDPDGPIASYAWDFGGGIVKSGATATHTYPAAGTYTVRLTVTDTSGSANAISRSVTVAPNSPPKAAFTSEIEDLKVTVNGSTSTDPDGSVASYAWDFGDGATETGVGASHTYAVAGTYTVRLTVTDDKGAKDSVERELTATASTLLARDDFERSVTGGWGSADRGGNWSIASGSSRFSVADGLGRISVGVGMGYLASLPSVSSSDTELKVSVSLDKEATGGGQYVSLIGRQVSGADDYRLKARVAAGGAVSLSLVKTVGGAETVLTSTTVSGLTYLAGEDLQLRLQVSGTDQSSLRAKAWTTSEPAAWAVTATDSTSSLQGPGAVGIFSYLSGSTANGPVAFSYDEMWAGRAA